MKKNKLLVLLSRSSLYLAWISAIISTTGSLYLSEILKFTPCHLCWMQRIFMYPLVIILGIGIFKKDNQVVFYSIPLSIIGVCFSIYHYLVQMFPSIEATASCSLNGVSCAKDYLNWFGFITIPLLALIGFSLIIVFSLIHYKWNRYDSNQDN